MLGLVPLVGLFGVLAYIALFVVLAALIGRHKDGNNGLRDWWHS